VKEDHHAGLSSEARMGRMKQEEQTKYL
jgi:hypothetical protein